MELTIKGITYPLKAGFRFLTKLEESSKKEISGDKYDWGLVEYYTQAFLMGDIRYLIKILLAMSEGQNPKLAKAILEEWIEELDGDEIDNLFSEVKDFLLKANVCRMKLKALGLTEKPEIQDIKA